jgi:D-tyrosyl-tRNA(Tyr) deacylase
MRAVLQRVSKASVIVDGREIARIGPGLLILLGIGSGDTSADAELLAEKCAQLRIFGDAEGKTNLSIRDTGGEALVVSQFTLYADTRKGRRPSFSEAAPPDEATRLVDQFSIRLQAAGVPTRQGIFGAYMVVDLTNDGPFTVLLESPAA